MRDGGSGHSVSILKERDPQKAEGLWSVGVTFEKHFTGCLRQRKHSNGEWGEY